MRLMLHKHKIKWITEKKIPLNEIDPINKIKIKITISALAEDNSKSRTSRKQIEVPLWMYEKATSSDVNLMWRSPMILNILYYIIL